MDTLSLLFGTALRVRMMRLFLFNPEGVFDLTYIEGKTGEKKRALEKEIKFFKKLGLIKSVKIKKKKGSSFALEHKFKFIDALTDFLIKTHSLEHKAIVRRLEKAGRIKAVIIAGVFIRNTESRLDLFVVGDNIKSNAFDRIVKSIELDMGKDIRYAVVSAPDFAYRISMNDKLVRDILDYPHKTLVDKIGVSK